MPLGLPTARPRSLLPSATARPGLRCALLNPYGLIPAACPELAEAACSTQGCTSRYGDVLTLSMLDAFFSLECLNAFGDFFAEV